MEHSIKKRTKQLLAAFLSVSMTLTALAGCSGGDTVISDTSEATAEAVTAETSDTTAAEPSEPFVTPSVKLLENRLRAENGLITDVEAVSTDGKCILTDTAFRVTAANDVSAEELKARLSLTPEGDFEVIREAERTYLLRSAQALPEGSVVKVAAADENGDIRDSWAFQTTESFRVKSVYPADGSDSVYGDSGIEIEFTTPVSAADAEDHFEITPALDGYFTTHRNTLYYIPEEAMKPRTAYTVTVKQGIKSAQSGELEEDYTFSFRTASNDRGDYFYTNNGFGETYLEGDPAVIEIYCSKALREKEFDVTLYRYSSAEEYYSVMKGFAENTNYFGDYTADTTGLTEVFHSKEKPTPNLVEWRPMFIMLPDDLTEGYYIADISVGELSAQYMIQVNPVSVFALSLGEESSFFINDTETGGAASGAEITLELGGKTYTAVTDKNGLASINTGANERGRGILDIKYNGSRYIDVFYTSYAEDESYKDMYYMYLYTDREAYLTSDTVKVWGVIRPRRDGAEIPEELSLCFGRTATEGELKKLNVAPDGTFSTEFTYTNHAESYFVYLTLLDGETEIHSKSIRIKDYVKPTYIFDVTLPDYAIMPHRDPITAEITAQYYEGTPAEGLLFESSARSCTPSTPKTDRNGYAEAELLFNDHTGWELSSASVTMRLTGIENEYTNEWNSIPAFYRDVMLETDYDKDTRTLSLTTASMDFGRIEEFLASAERNDRGYSEYDYDILKSAPFNTEVTVNITHHWSEKVEYSTYYDYIEKRTVTKYRYVSHNDSIGSYTVSTVNGKGVLEALPLTSDKGSYSFDIYYTDTLGQHVDEYFNVYNGSEYNYYRDSRYLTYSFEDADGSEEDGFSYGFRENETLDLYLDCNGNAVTENKGRIFFAVYQHDFLTEEVYDSVEFSYAPSLECLPNARFGGAYFDGRHVYPVYGGMMSFNPEERNIILEAETDKDTYDAGETVRLSVRALDEQGRPVSGAAVSLSVVDEAAFAIAPQSVDILSNLYSYIYYPYASSYYSYIQHVMDDSGGGERGGGDGDSSVRKDFKDNAYFGSELTDAQGRAEFVFRLADNLTTWRATLQAVKELETGRVYAGDRIYPIISTRPLFITPIMLDTYMEGDDIAVTAKCHGIDSGDEITVRITGGNIDKTLSARSAETVNFGKLPMGEYKVLFTAEKDGNSDAVELPLTVTDTILETDITRAFDLSEGIDIKPTKWPVSVTFFDKEYMFYTDILRELIRYCGERTDMRIASSFAGMELGYISEEEYIASHASVTYDGLARLLPNSGESAELTALIAAAAPKLIDRAAVIPELELSVSSRNSDKADICIGYMGLAALGEPVLEEVRSALESGEFTDYYDKMRLTAALALCGDYDAAYSCYVEFTPKIALLGSDPDNIMACIECDGGEEQERTKLALITAALLKLPEAEYFARFLIGRDPVFDSYALELMIYLQNYAPKVEGDAVFTYNLNGETETVTLDRHRGYKMRFGEEQFGNADFTVTSGSVYAVVRYIGRVTEQSGPAEIKITKSISGDLSPGGLVRVTIKTNSYASVEDVIPSCGRYIDKPDDCYSRSGQRVSLFTDKYGSASYCFRITTEGEYVLESAVVQDGSGWGASERSTITAEYSNAAV